MKPNIHAELSVQKYGGDESDYQKIHDWFDQTKAHHADMRHRAILHNSWGIFLCEQFFGTYIVNSDGKRVQVRDIGEDHVLQDLGRIPALTEFLSLFPIETISKFSQPKRKTKSISISDAFKKMPKMFEHGKGQVEDTVEEAFKKLSKEKEVLEDIDKLIDTPEEQIKEDDFFQPMEDGTTELQPDAFDDVDDEDDNWGRQGILD